MHGRDNCPNRERLLDLSEYTSTYLEGALKLAAPDGALGIVVTLYCDSCECVHVTHLGVDTPEHRESALVATRRAATLLRIEGGSQHHDPISSKNPN